MRVVSRTQWGARRPRCTTPLRTGLWGVAFHYSASDADEQADHANCAGRVKGIQAFHMSPGWDGIPEGGCDIAYNHLVCAHGYVFTGRGYNVRSAANGTNEGNSRYYAVCVLCNDDSGEREITPAVQQALIDLRKEYLKRYPSADQHVGHRDIRSTSCPGDELYRFIKSRSFEASLHTGRLPGPSPKPAWFWVWGDWYLAGRPLPRPSGLPQPIPQWAYQALDQWRRDH